MSTQPNSVNPATAPYLEPYVDSKQAAVFLAFDWKKVQKLSRGQTPSTPGTQRTAQPAHNLAVQAQ